MALFPNSRSFSGPRSNSRTFPGLCELWTPPQGPRVCSVSHSLKKRQGAIPTKGNFNVRQPMSKRQLHSAASRKKNTPYLKISNCRKCKALLEDPRQYLLNTFHKEKLLVLNTCYIFRKTSKIYTIHVYISSFFLIRIKDFTT